MTFMAFMVVKLLIEWEQKGKKAKRILLLGAFRKPVSNFKYIPASRRENIFRQNEMSTGAFKEASS